MISRTTLCPVPRAWILSPGARRFYLFCAITELVLFLSLVGAQVAPAFGANNLAETFLTGISGSRVLSWLGALCWVLLTLAMWLYWLAFDRSTFVRRLIWFLPLFLGVLIGPIVYYFAVYRPQSALDASNAPSDRPGQKSN
jgi:hypothetical protein